MRRHEDTERADRIEELARAVQSGAMTVAQLRAMLSTPGTPASDVIAARALLRTFGDTSNPFNR